MQTPSLPSCAESQYGLSWWVQENLNGFHGVLAQGGHTAIQKEPGERSPNPDPSPVAIAARTRPSPAMIGKWRGFVQTYRGRVPLTLNVGTSGERTAQLGVESEVRRAHAQFGESVVRWTMPGSLGVEGEPFDLAMRLYIHGSVLAGAARTEPPPSSRNGVWVYYYWVQLERE
jgi:hypothetical protein